MFKKLFDKFVDMMERYNRYKMAAILSRHVRDPDELRKMLDELYGTQTSK